MERKRFFFMPTTNNIKIEDLIDSFDVNIPSKEKFLQLSNICPINPIKPENNSNLERGILLYGLISKYKPKNVLEIGTAEGFSTLCMAWAMTDCKIDGKIFTIDPKPFDAPKKRVNSWENSKKNQLVLLSTKELWNKFAEPEWLKKIEVLTGSSGEILEKMSNQLPKMDLGFIDGHHVYNAVLHDFHAFLKISSEKFQIIFDDYFQNGDIAKGDVAKVVDEQIVPNFDVTFIKTNPTMKKSINDPKEGSSMCWIDSNSLENSLEEIFPKTESNKIINDYQKWEKRWKLRKNINKKIPFLGKIKFNR